MKTKEDAELKNGREVKRHKRETRYGIHETRLTKSISRMEGQQIFQSEVTRDTEYNSGSYNDSCAVEFIYSTIQCSKETMDTSERKMKETNRKKNTSRNEIHGADSDHTEDLLHNYLRKGTGIRNAEFKLQSQRQAMVLSVEKMEDFLYIDGKGGGKSTVFLGPPALETGVTFVVVPLTPLRKDLIEKCQKMRIEVREFKYLSYNEDHIPAQGLVVCSPEDILYQFKYYESIIRTYIQMKRLNRIVIDEAHLTYFSDNYRPSMAFMKRFRPDGVDVQLILLIATVPKSLQTEILTSNGCVPGEVRIVRGNLRRMNIQINVEELKDGKEETLMK